MDKNILELEIIDYVVNSIGDNNFAITNLKTEYFFSELGRVGWEIITERNKNNKEINLRVFEEELKRRNIEYVNYVVSGDCGTCESLSKELISNWKIYKIRELYSKMNNDISLGGEIDQVIGEFLNKSMDLSTASISEDTSIKPAVSEYLDRLTDRVSGNKIIGYSWGIPDMDDAIGGIEPGRIYVIAALKKTGKSRFIISVMDTLCKAGINTFFISLEMTKVDVVSWLSTKNIRASCEGRYISKENLKKTGDFLPIINDYPIRVSEMPADISRIEGLIRSHVAKHKIKVVFIDYFQQIRKPALKGMSISSVMDMEAYRLQSLAKELKVAIVYLSQMPVEAERMKQKGESAGIGYLKGSGGMAEAADVIMVMDNENRNCPGENSRRQLLKITFWGRRCVSGYSVNLSADLEILDFSQVKKDW